MAFFLRSKRVTDPLNDKVKACICGKQATTNNNNNNLNSTVILHSSSSSGSEHEGEECDEDCLSNLVHDFFEQECIQENDIEDDCMDSDDDDHHCRTSSSESQVKESIKRLLCLNPAANPGYSLLVHHLSVAMKMFDSSLNNKSLLQRKVMMFLRDLGHNAGICKTKWETSGGLTAGTYDYIDVVVVGKWEGRYIIDVDFAGEFEIARPTSQYKSLSQILPRVYIGRSEELKQIVRLMCDAAKRSLKSRDLFLPPWRKNRYMQLKWFGAYRRTINPISSKVTEKVGVKCRAVGFNAVSNGDGKMYFPAATRTR